MQRLFTARESMIAFAIPKLKADLVPKPELFAFLYIVSGRIFPRALR